MSNKRMDKQTAKLLANIANSDFIACIIEQLCVKIEDEAVMGNYHCETTLLSELGEDELRVVECRIKNLGFTFKIKQIDGCKDRVVIGWDY